MGMDWFIVTRLTEGVAADVLGYSEGTDAEDACRNIAERIGIDGKGLTAALWPWERGAKPESFTSDHV